MNETTMENVPRENFPDWMRPGKWVLWGEPQGIGGRYDKWQTGQVFGTDYEDSRICVVFPAHDPYCYWTMPEVLITKCHPDSLRPAKFVEWDDVEDCYDDLRGDTMREVHENGRVVYHAITSIAGRAPEDKQPTKVYINHEHFKTWQDRGTTVDGLPLGKIVLDEEALQND